MATGTAVAGSAASFCTEPVLFWAQTGLVPAELVLVTGPLEAEGFALVEVTGTGDFRRGWGEGCFGANVLCMGGGFFTGSTGFGLGCLTGSTGFGLGCLTGSTGFGLGCLTGSTGFGC